MITPKHSNQEIEKLIDDAVEILREPGGREKLKAQTLVMKVCVDIMAGKYDDKVEEIKRKGKP